MERAQFSANLTMREHIALADLKLIFQQQPVDDLRIREAGDDLLAKGGVEMLARVHGAFSRPGRTADVLRLEDIWAGPGGFQPPEAAAAIAPIEEPAALADLLAIFAAHPDGFEVAQLRAGEAQAVARIRSIGASFNAQSGMTAMLRVHSDFARQVRLPGAARNLEYLWDHIGEWRG